MYNAHTLFFCSVQVSELCNAKANDVLEWSIRRLQAPRDSVQDCQRWQKQSCELTQHSSRHMKSRTRVCTHLPSQESTVKDAVP